MGLVTPNPGTIFWMVIVFGIVFMILKNFAWKPILNALRERETSITNALMAADQARLEIANLMADQETIRLEAQKEKEQILREAREIRDNIIAEARDRAILETQRSVEHARDLIHLEKMAAINDIKKQVVELSVSIAERILREKVKSSAQQEKIIDVMLQDLTLN